ncbi:MAG: PTS sugar transporter subunit IIB [candidate division FCPU426 bacterium]
MPANLVLTRLDDRLIHGQVAVGWAKVTKPEVLLVADDQVEQDSLRRTLMEMAGAPGTKVLICRVEETAAACNRLELDGKRTLLLFSSPWDVCRAVDRGLRLQELNVGGLRYSPGKRQILKAIAVDEEDMKAFQKLVQEGVRVTVQMVPTDEPVDIRKYFPPKG